MKTYTLFLFVLLFLWGCSSEEPIVETPEPVEDTGEIQLKGNFRAGGINVSTRGDGPVTGTKPSKALSIDMYRLDASSGTTYTGKLYAKLPATMGTDGKIGFTSPAKEYWLTNPTISTKLIGIYPQVAAGSFTQSSGVITYTSDGATDIISGVSVQGSRDSRATAMTFKHLLSQVKVTIVSSDANVPAKWGNVSSVTIRNKKGTCTVTLPAVGTAAGAQASVSALTGTSNVAVTTATGDPVSAMAIPTTGIASTFGYLMFPPTTNDALVLDIVTALGGTQTKTLTAQNFVAGTAYEIKINFTLQEISLTATLADWTAGTTINVTM